MRELAAVFANEWMKLVHRRRFLVTAILTIFVVALFGVITNHRYQNVLQYNPVTQTQNQISNVKQEITRLEAQKKSQSRDTYLNQMKHELVALQTGLKGMQGGQLDNDWKASGRQQITMDQNTIDKFKGSKNIQDIAQAQGARGDLLRMQYTLDHNVKALGWPDIDAYRQVNGFMSVGAKIFFPLLVVILVADMISGEATDGTIKLLLIRPVSRMKILLGKWLVSLFATCLWSLALCAALLLTAFGIMGARGGNQPMLINVYYTMEKVTPSDPASLPYSTLVAHYDHASVLPIWQFIVDGFLYTVLAMMIVATISILCSTLFRSSMVSSAAAMGSIIVGFIVSQMGRHETWVNWLFPTHLNLLDNWSGQLSETLEQNVGLNVGLIVLAVWGIVALVISLLQFTKRDVLNA